MESLHDIAMQILRQRGIDPDAEPEDDMPRHDPTAYRIQQAEAALAATIPGRFLNARVEHPTVADWVARFNADHRGAPSLALAGTLGTGKTHQAFAALRAVVITAARRGLPVRFRVISHPQLNQLLRPKSDGSHENALEPFETTDLLLLDDVGAGVQSDWTGDSLHRLIDHRWSAPLPSIFTTNLSGADLAKAVGARVKSRIFDSMRVNLKGEDRRHTPGGVQ